MQRDLPFVGRTDHLETFEDARRAAEDGDRLVLAIEGGAGTGKSRLLGEMELRLAATGFDIRQAQVFPAWTTRPDALADALGLAEIDRGTTTALLVDDAHAADRSSIAALRELLLRPGDGGLLVILTHRPIDEPTAPGLHRLLEAIHRRGDLRQLSLRPLTPADIAGITGGPAADELAQRLSASSGGSPLALQELIDDLIAQGSVRWDGDLIVPVRPVADWPEARTLRERVAELPRDARTLVEATALAGGPVPLDIAAHLVDRDVDDVLELGEDLVQRGLLNESVGGFLPRTNAAAERLVADIGEVRRSRILGSLAAAADATGLSEARPGLVGSYHLRGGNPEGALPLLTEAALDAVRRDAYAEALPLASGALEALDGVRDRDPELEGELRFARARCHRMLGRSDLADEDADVAARLLDGEAQMRVRGWQAQIADDEQQASRGEWLTALAELAAAQQGDLGNLGGLLTLRAKMLGRLGLAVEADACLKRGIRLLRLQDDERARFLGHWNGAWLAFDRGQVGIATTGFEYCAHHARGFEGEEWLAQAEAWLARSLLWSGRIEGALEARDRALEAADRSDSVGPVFLAALGSAEGMWLLGRYDDALAAADEALAIVHRQIPVWENVVRYWRASALLGRGDTDDAVREAELAVAACPDGPDGERWRTACRALHLEATAAAGRGWAPGEAASLTRTLIEARWFAAAIRLLIARAAHEDDAEHARRAAALAHELGIPLLAASAVTTGDLWDEPIAPAIAADVRETAARIPDAWHDEWASSPTVAPALSAPEGEAGARLDAARALDEHLDQVLLQGGVVRDDLRIGPREWSEPLPRVRTAEEDRRRRVGALLAVGAAVLVLGGAAIGGILRTGPADDDAPPVVAEEHSIDIIAPSDMIVGSWMDRGGPARSGVGTREAGGIEEFDGLYWEPFCTGAPIRSSPAIHGQFAYFGAGENVYAINMTSGEQFWRQPTDGEVRAAPTVAGRVGEGGLAEADPMVIAASRDGTVHAWTTGGERRWSTRVASRIESSPLFHDDVIYIGSHDGYLHALEAASGEELWRFPEDEPAGVIRSSPAAVDGLILIGSDDGSVYAIQHGDGQLAWSGSTGAAVVATPAVHDGVVYAASLGESVWAFDLRSGRPAGTVGTYRTDRQLGASPAIDDERIYIPSNVRLLALDIETGEVDWSLRTGAAIASSPVIAGDLIYVGSDDGSLYAVDRTEGQTGREPRWSFETGNAISASPAVADGVVLIGSTDGCLYALGEAAEPSDEPEDEQTPSG